MVFSFHDKDGRDEGTKIEVIEGMFCCKRWKLKFLWIIVMLILTDSKSRWTSKK